MPTILDRITFLMDREQTNSATLCKTLGLSNSTFSDWKKGKGSPGVAALVKFSQHFGVTMDYLVFGTEEKTNTLEFSNPQEQALLEKYRQLPPEFQDKVLGYIEGMLSVLPEQKQDARLSG